MVDKNAHSNDFMQRDWMIRHLIVNIIIVGLIYVMVSSYIEFGFWSGISFCFIPFISWLFVLVQEELRK